MVVSNLIAEYDYYHASNTKPGILVTDDSQGLYHQTGKLPTSVVSGWGAA